ncbi:unnamed protein product [Spirodela intermedia]|uniref:Uncharacterized protein n=1 Tax=Spirodela intermedia TaxID=51605 RepID=A0A7I8JAT7_SPIIN|nr:unnamed protein product [Spirodela intermedia]CAA6666562.1 unnamed protein product [Spirodela intermedia]
MFSSAARSLRCSLLSFHLFHSLVDSRVEDSEFVDSEAGFFPKIGALWIQAHILFIFRIITAGSYVFFRIKYPSELQRSNLISFRTYFEVRLLQNT